jgi:hypothetical protein
MNLNLLNQKFKTGYLSLKQLAGDFIHDRVASFDISKIMEPMMLLIMLPIFMGFITGAVGSGSESTDTMITAITGIIPLVIVMDMMKSFTSSGRRR